MTTTIETEFTSRRDARAAAPRKGKSRPIIAFALAALAIGGIGAAATSAAWTDNVFFSAQAEAASFNLKGSLDGKTFVESDSAEKIELVIPADKLANLLPGQTRTIDLWVTNEGTVNAALTGSVAFTASTFAENPKVSVSGLVATLTPVTTTGATDQFQLVVTTPADWSTKNQKATGTIVVTIAGTATA